MDRFGRAWSGLLALTWASCTVVSQPSSVTSDDAGPDAAAADGGDSGASEDSDGSLGTGMPPAREACDGSQSLRCGSAGRQRERCQDGFWTPTVECGEGEVCTADPAAGARCLGVASVCRGSPSAIVCDGKGVMYHCGADGVIESSETCPSARHCQLGVAAKSCAACLPGEFRCSGDKLERCDADAQGFSNTQSCAAGSCDAAGGRCRGTACAETRSICHGDELQTCKQGESEFHDGPRCEPGLCDATTGSCDRCVPGQSTCEGDTALRCSADGSSQERVNCGAEAGHCVGAGRCVRCTRDADCDDPGACMRAYCNLVSGRCQPQARASGTPCPQGVCSADGKCVGCVSDGDCPMPGDCQVRHCDTASGSCMPRPAAKGMECGVGKCDGAGQCVGCTADSDCPEAPACQTRHCDTKTGSCKPTNAMRGTKCAAGVCDGSGKCAGCNGDADCPDPVACQTRHCDAATHTCDPKPQADRTTCSAAFGAGVCLSGRCVQCADDKTCRSSALCDEPFCRTSDNTCQTRPIANGVSCDGDSVCDGASRCVECTSDLHCGANSSCLSNVCHCNEGFTKNPSGKGCNYDECVKFDDNRCGPSDGGNSCANTVSGYDCRCVAPWQSGSGQCFQAGVGSNARTVKNGAAWNVVPDFNVVCDNAFDMEHPCANKGQLVFLNVCGLPGTTPGACSGLSAFTDGLAGVSIRRVDYSGPLEQYGQPPADGFTDKADISVGSVVLVQSLAYLYIMRITAIDGGGMSYEWAAIWRDTCWRPGGPRCTAACNCPGGN
ncbi:MAG TPA: hypothetical protein VJV78_24950 [Polyangiales bacterium]|nr:hypothetical protein [Polyangiales bacterium]